MFLARQRTALCCLLALLWTLPGKVQAADPGPPLVLEQTIPLPGISGRIDHMAVDLRRGRLFVAELGNGTVDVSGPCGREGSSGALRGLKEPRGVGYAPQGRHGCRRQCRGRVGPPVRRRGT